MVRLMRAVKMKGFALLRQGGSGVCHLSESSSANPQQIEDRRSLEFANPWS
jgi:hypothetical protein